MLAADSPPAIEPWPQSRMRVAILLSLLAAVIATSAFGEEYRVYTEHPRLLLRSQRLRLLKRERERQSMRWRPR